MAKKIRFPLAMADGVQIRTLDELKEHFDLEAVLEYYKSGKLLTWLQDRYLETEAEAIQALDEHSTDLPAELCKIFDVEYHGDPIDVDEIARRQERLKQLRTYTDEKDFIDHIDQVAFSQEELADLLDDGQKQIYLCGEKFSIPLSQHGVHYIGINSPKVSLSGSIPAGFSLNTIDISIIGCHSDISIHATTPSFNALTPSLPDDEDAVSRAIAHRLASRAEFIARTSDYICFFSGPCTSSDFYCINTHSGQEKIIPFNIPNSTFVRIHLGGVSENRVYFTVSGFPFLGRIPEEERNRIKILDIETETIHDFPKCYPDVHLARFSLSKSIMVIYSYNRAWWIDLADKNRTFEVNANFKISDALIFDGQILLTEENQAEEDTADSLKIALHWYDQTSNTTQLAIQNGTVFDRYALLWEASPPTIMWLKHIKDSLLLAFNGSNAFSLCLWDFKKASSSFTLL